MIYRRLFGLPTWRLRRRFDELEHMRRQMDRIFGELNRGPVEKSISGVFPAINLTENMATTSFERNFPVSNPKISIYRLR